MSRTSTSSSVARRRKWKPKTTAVNRDNGMLRTLNRKPKMIENYFQLMGKVFKHGHAVPVPQDELLTPNNNPNRKEPLKRAKINWSKSRRQESKTRDAHGTYLTLGCTIPGIRIRSTWCSIRQPSYKGSRSSNKELLPDPDPLNCLVGVLICFCQDNIAVMCDIEQNNVPFVSPELSLIPFV